MSESASPVPPVSQPEEKKPADPLEKTSVSVSNQTFHDRSQQVTKSSGEVGVDKRVPAYGPDDWDPLVQHIARYLVSLDQQYQNMPDNPERTPLSEDSELLLFPMTRKEVSEVIKPLKEKREG